MALVTGIMVKGSGPGIRTKMVLGVSPEAKVMFMLRIAALREGGDAGREKLICTTIRMKDRASVHVGERKLQSRQAQ